VGLGPDRDPLSGLGGTCERDAKPFSVFPFPFFLINMRSLVLVGRDNCLMHANSSFVLH